MKTVKKLAAVISFICIITIACPIPAQAANVKLNHTKRTMHVTDTVVLKVIGKSQKNIRWKSSNPAIVTVSKTGKATAKKAGTAKVTAKIGSKKLTCKITVKKTGVSSSIKKNAKQNAKLYHKQIVRMLNETNRYRIKNGLPKLKLNKKLTEIACYRSVEMARKDKMSHVRPDGTRAKDLLRQYGFKCRSVKENIGADLSMNADDPVDIDDSVDFVEIWYDSTSHRRNMLNKKAKQIGIGIAFANEWTVYYTQLFVY